MNAWRGAAALLAAAALALGLAACGGGDDEAAGDGAAAPETTAAPTTTAPPATSAPAPAPAPPPAPTALPGLPPYTAGFQRWDTLNREPIPPNSPATRRVGFDAHLGTKDVYVSVPRERLRPGSDYPDGTIVVKAARDGADITLVAIMRKIQGVDPGHGDWEFVEYKRPGGAGSFATDASLKDGTCWGCHAIAEETDWVFTTLER